jgi:hypothetical protein
LSDILSAQLIFIIQINTTSATIRSVSRTIALATFNAKAYSNPRPDIFNLLSWGPLSIQTAKFIYPLIHKWYKLFKKFNGLQIKYFFKCLHFKPSRIAFSAIKQNITYLSYHCYIENHITNILNICFSDSIIRKSRLDKYKLKFSIICLSLRTYAS